jgi:twitching motility protein PilT
MEVLVVNIAAAALIRESKTVQIPSVMQSNKALGNQMLNEDLARLVEQKRILYEEALSHAVDKADLARRCGRPAP